jgi:hypothetical protein
LLGCHLVELLLDVTFLLHREGSSIEIVSLEETCLTGGVGSGVWGICVWSLGSTQIFARRHCGARPRLI